MTEDWSDVNRQRPLGCPLCQYRFSFRDYVRAERTCPTCKVPIGMPFYYRVILTVASLTVFGLILDRGYHDGIGGFMVSLPFAALFGFFAKVAILRVFPPKLQAYADGNTWLTLNTSNSGKAPGTAANSH